MKKLLILILLASALTSEARLGETLAECKLRYGEPSLLNDEEMHHVFSKNGMAVMAVFRDDRCIQLSFKKEGLGGSLSAEEVQLLLHANGAGKKWIRSKEQPMSDVWETEDQAKHAVHVPIVGILTLTTKEGREILAKEKAVADKKKLEDF